MRPIRLALLLLLVALPLVFTASASGLDINVDEQPPPGEVGTPYEFQFEGEEGCLPYRFSYLNGALPPGLRITPEGKLTGTPTEAGTFYFWVALDDNAGPTNPYCLEPSTQSQGDFTMIVRPDLAVTTSTLPLGAPGRPYSAQLEFSNPEAGWPVIWDVVAGALPGGLTLSESGRISGTPSGHDTKTFTVRAREPFRRSGAKELTLTVAGALSASSSLGPGEVGLRYSGKVSGAGGIPPLKYAVEVGTLPAGLTLSSETGAISGSPTAAGTFGVTFLVTDRVGQRASVPVNLRIAGRLAITTASLRSARVGAAYRTRLRSTGGLAPKRWRVASGALPRGIRLDASKGTLSGVARQAGTFRFTVEATDRLGVRSTKRLQLTARA